MDSLVASAARLLAAGDPLGALKRVALRDDLPALALRGIAMGQLGGYERARKLSAHNRAARPPALPALALRGIAMAQLGDYERARKLLRHAARGFGPRERLPQARCPVARAERAHAAPHPTHP